METYRIKSLIGAIAEGIEQLVRQGVIYEERKIILHGLDRNSFAMRTILSNLGYANVEGYISDDKALVLQYKTEIKNFACRFLNHKTDLIDIWTVEERLKRYDQTVTILITSKCYEKEKARLEELGYKENIHFYKVYDFKETELDKFLKNKTKMSLQEIKRTEKEILKYVDIICKKNSLRYWVCGGTLLGTIRHKGFIPWDDDIDIFLPWRDYLQFIHVFEETERFGMMGFGTSEVNDFADPFAKVLDKRTVVNEDIGTVRKINPLWIDVFPLVGLPDNEEERDLFFADYKELNRGIWQEFYALNGDTNIFSQWYGKQKEFLSRYDFDESGYVGVLGTAYGERDCTTRRVYNETLRMPFEDIEVNVPVGFEEYLGNLYGSDWMVLPDESKRRTHHNISAYWNGKV